MKGTEEEGPVIDFSGVTPFEPLDEAIPYLCLVSAMELGRGPAGQKVHCEFTVDQPEECETTDEKGKAHMIKCKGRKLFREFSLVSQALPYFYSFLQALGEKELGEHFVLNTKKYFGQHPQQVAQSKDMLTHQG